MSITISVRLSSGSYHARAMGLGVTASSAEGAQAAARAVCRKLGLEPRLLENTDDDKDVTRFVHPGEEKSS
ncbi:hypothetical protein PMM47T1_14100 [Pseudomonas sp. M47T1]|nr:hypothetical protein PMM47T1_14100 [Pseudomonas sp. M47T1]